MFRRRPFRRFGPLMPGDRRPWVNADPLGRRPLRGVSPIAPGVPLEAVGPRVREALVRAHQALEQGDTGQAAHIFRRLAGRAARRGMLLQAVGLLLEAAYAEALGGQAHRAVEDARQALEALGLAPVPERVAATAERLAAALRQGGHEPEAIQVQESLERALQRTGSSRRQVAESLAAFRSQPRGRLPSKCPSCGGPLLPDEVEWHGPDAIECPYCGSVVTTV